MANRWQIHTNLEFKSYSELFGVVVVRGIRCLRLYTCWIKYGTIKTYVCSVWMLESKRASQSDSANENVCMYCLCVCVFLSVDRNVNITPHRIPFTKSTSYCSPNHTIKLSANVKLCFALFTFVRVFFHFIWIHS